MNKHLLVTLLLLAGAAYAQVLPITVHVSSTNTFQPQITVFQANARTVRVVFDDAIVSNRNPYFIWTPDNMATGYVPASASAVSSNVVDFSFSQAQLNYAGGISGIYNVGASNTTILQGPFTIIADNYHGGASTVQFLTKINCDLTTFTGTLPWAGGGGGLTNNTPIIDASRAFRLPFDTGYLTFGDNDGFGLYAKASDFDHLYFHGDLVDSALARLDEIPDVSALVSTGALAGALGAYATTNALVGKVDANSGSVTGLTLRGTTSMPSGSDFNLGGNDASGGVFNVWGAPGTYQLGANGGINWGNTPRDTGRVGVRRYDSTTLMVGSGVYGASDPANLIVSNLTVFGTLGVGVSNAWVAQIDVQGQSGKVPMAIRALGSSGANLINIFDNSTREIGYLWSNDGIISLTSYLGLSLRAGNSLGCEGLHIYPDGSLGAPGPLTVGGVITAHCVTNPVAGIWQTAFGEGAYADPDSVAVGHGAIGSLPWDGNSDHTDGSVSQGGSSKAQNVSVSYGWDAISSNYSGAFFAHAHAGNLPGDRGYCWAQGPWTEAHGNDGWAVGPSAGTSTNYNHQRAFGFHAYANANNAVMWGDHQTNDLGYSYMIGDVYSNGLYASQLIATGQYATVRINSGTITVVGTNLVYIVGGITNKVTLGAYP